MAARIEYEHASHPNLHPVRLSPGVFESTYRAIVAYTPEEESEPEKRRFGISDHMQVLAKFVRERRVLEKQKPGQNVIKPAVVWLTHDQQDFVTSMHYMFLESLDKITDRKLLASGSKAVESFIKSCAAADRKPSNFQPARGIIPYERLKLKRSEREHKLGI